MVLPRAECLFWSCSPHSVVKTIVPALPSSAARQQKSSTGIWYVLHLGEVISRKCGSHTVKHRAYVYSLKVISNLFNLHTVACRCKRCVNACLVCCFMPQTCKHLSLVFVSDSHIKGGNFNEFDRIETNGVKDCYFCACEGSFS